MLDARLDPLETVAESGEIASLPAPVATTARITAKVTGRVATEMPTLTMRCQLQGSTQ
jgi:hypothetical protein